MFGPASRPVSPVTSTVASTFVGVATTSTEVVPKSAPITSPSETDVPSIVKRERLVSSANSAAEAAAAKFPIPEIGIKTSKVAAKSAIKREPSIFGCFTGVSDVFICYFPTLNVTA